MQYFLVLESKTLKPVKQVNTLNQLVYQIGLNQYTDLFKLAWFSFCPVKTWYLPTCSV